MNPKQNIAGQTWQVLPWGKAQTHDEEKLQVVLQWPEDWEIVSSNNRSINLEAPPTGNPPFKVKFMVSCLPTPQHSPESLPIVLDQLLEAVVPTDATEFTSTAKEPIRLGSFPGYNKKSSWTSQGWVWRRISLVAVVFDVKIYIYTLITREDLSNEAFEVFIQILRTVAYNIPGTDQPSESVEKSSTDQAPPSESDFVPKFFNHLGRWVGQR